jgi:periplasmic protein TonB
MFAEYCDSTLSQHSHRGWTTLASFSLQALIVGVLLATPLLYNHALPRLTFRPPMLMPPAPPPAAPVGSHVSTPVPATSSNHLTAIVLTTPSRIATGIAAGPDAPPPVDAGALGFGRRDGTPGGTGSVLNGILYPSAVGPPPQPPPVARAPRPSRMMEGNLIHRVQPEYPVLARQARIQGAVVLRAVISREGNIENLQVVSGHPMLAPAALEAVRQWRYRPYSLNGEAVEVETQVTVNFVLGP